MKTTGRGQLGRSFKGRGWREIFGGAIGGRPSKVLVAIKIAVVLIAALLILGPVVALIVANYLS